MPTIQEIKDLNKFMVSDTIDTPEFILYYNACLNDLSEVMKYEKNMAEFTINSNENETTLPADLFQIVSVVVTDSDGYNSVAFEVGTNDEESLNNRVYRNAAFDKRSHVYSRWNSKIFIKSEHLTEDANDSRELTINIKYYGSLPTVDYTAESIDLNQLPPIKEVHYHSVISHYIAYMYYSNTNDKTEADSHHQTYLLKKAEIRDYVNKHRHNSNLNKTIKSVRRT